ncbi:MAG: DUF2520 domain-containing protein [Planctomycetes bacterium]|nr:DUF2520 domain-containing protein [Planctomycetota bacterium]
MAVPFAVIGPGRVGCALARAWGDAGFACLGFVGRDAARAADACAFAGAGRPLRLDELGAATVVLIALPDDALAAWLSHAAQRAVARSCSLWLCASGALGAAELAELGGALGCRVGSFHPLCPVPDREQGLAALRGAPVLVEVPASAQRLSGRLARAAGLRPLHATVADRVLYHAACVLAANGTTALLDAAEALFGRATDLAPGELRAVATSLARAAVERSAQVGAERALSGPALRGDAALVARHASALREIPGALDLYRAVTQRALDIARRRGLAAERADAVALALDGGRDG